MRLAALALLGPAGQIERSSETFRLRYGGAAELVQQSPELGRVLLGEIDRTAVSAAGLEVTIEAVTDSGGTRRALLTFATDPAAPASQASNALLAEPLDDSPAIVWLKDLDGRYLRVNRRYTGHLGMSEDHFRGRTDAELAPHDSIDGPRLLGRDPSASEPMQLEYTVPQLEGRPALAVLRFPVRDRGGKPIAVCSVAAPHEAGQVAHAEAARLMEVERFSRADGQAIRAEYLRAWDVVASGSGPEAGTPDPAPPPVQPAQPPAMQQAPGPPPPLRQAPGSPLRQEPPRPPLQQSPTPPPPQQAPPPPPVQQAPLPPPVQQAPAPPVQQSPRPPLTPIGFNDTDDPVADLAAERDSALAAKAELGRELAHAQLGLVELASMRAQTKAAYARVEELEREVSDARERAAEAEGRARTDAEQVRIDAERAHAEAEHARAELEGLRTESESPPVGHVELGSSLPAPFAHAPERIHRDDEDAFDSAVRWLPTAQRKLSASLGRMSVWRTVLKETVTIIGSEGGWDAVTAWVPDEQGGLACAAMWTSHPGLGAFESETWDVAQARPGSLPVQALHAPHLTWVMEIDAVDDDRLGSAAVHGLRSALLLPIRDGAVTIALLELLAHASVKPDAQIAMSLEAAALQLGQFGHLLRVSG